MADLELLVGEQHLAGLVHVRARVGVDLLAGQHRPRRRAAARVAHARGVVADDQHDGVARVLELAQLLEHDGVAEVDVGGGRVEPELDPQRTAFGEPPLERSVGEAVDRVAGEMGGRAERRPGRFLPSGPMLEWPPGRRLSAVRGELAAPGRPAYGFRPPQPPGRRRRRRTRRRWSHCIPSTPRETSRPKVPVRIRKLRVLALLAGLGLLAIVSTVFGMMMAVASDLPELEEPVRAELGDRRPPRRAPRPPDRQPRTGSWSRRGRSRRS